MAGKAADRERHPALQQLEADFSFTSASILWPPAAFDFLPAVKSWQSDPKSSRIELPIGGVV
jgi:hypothetical protein